MYLYTIIQKYQAKDIANYSYDITKLKNMLQTWADRCYLDIIDSGSRVKGTAISIASDVDFMVSLTSHCNENSGGLKSLYDLLYRKLNSCYSNVRKQNVAVRITLGSMGLSSNGLEVDITPARKQCGNTNNHSLWFSKLSTWKQTNIQKHIDDVSQSGRINEIKLLKIWRELNDLDFPSIYLEYLLIGNILSYKLSGLDNLANNFEYILSELSKTKDNPLLSTIVDPANSNNILSELLKKDEKDKIYSAAKFSIIKYSTTRKWNDIIR